MDPSSLLVLPQGFRNAGLGTYIIHKIEIKETAMVRSPPPGILSVFVFPSLTVIREYTSIKKNELVVDSVWVSNGWPQLP